MRPRTLALTLLALLLLALAPGCNDDECRERIDPVEREEEQRETIAEILDDADVPDARQQQILDIYTGMKPTRDRVRAAQKEVFTAMLHELVQPRPSPERARAHVDALARHVTAYAHGVVDEALKAHGLLDPAQRAAVAAEIEDAEGSFPSDFMIDRGVDYVLYKLDATTPQEVRIIEIKDAMMARFKTLQTRQGRERELLLDQWRSATPEEAAIHASIDRASAQMTAFGQRALDAYLRVLAALRPEQRAWLDGRVEAMKTCPEQ